MTRLVQLHWPSCSGPSNSTPTFLVLQIQRTPGVCSCIGADKNTAFSWYCDRRLRSFQRLKRQTLLADITVDR